MEFYRVSLEAHGSGATLYVAGLLADRAADRVSELIESLHDHTGVVRVDLRGVLLIDPSAFIRVARDLNRWRDGCQVRRLVIQFPERSQRRYGAHLELESGSGDDESSIPVPVP
jgi:hypothetical protein